MQLAPQLTSAFCQRLISISLLQCADSTAIQLLPCKAGLHHAEIRLFPANIGMCHAEMRLYNAEVGLFHLRIGCITVML